VSVDLSDTWVTRDVGDVEFSDRGNERFGGEMSRSALAGRCVPDRC
jgi:hypothetical protein